jgi:hypothetical protein
MGLNPPAQGNLVKISIGGRVWTARELFYGLVTLIEAVNGYPAGDYKLRWTRVGAVVVEIWG